MQLFLDSDHKMNHFHAWKDLNIPEMYLFNMVCLLQVGIFNLFYLPYTSRGFSLAWILVFMKSFAWLVSHISSRRNLYSELLVVSV